MLTPQIAATMLDESSNDRDVGKDEIVKLYHRTVDVLKGYVKMVEKAEPEFLPVAQRFHDLHARHASALVAKLSAMGIAADDGTLMGTINETVVGVRAFFDEIDADLMSSIRNGENHVLEAFDDALDAELSPDDAADISAMRDELVGLLEDTRDID